jgi:hypothetical protein
MAFYMYYICKFSDSWSLYDGKKNSSRLLDKSEIDCLKNLFPALLIDNGNILTALQVSSIQPNKLVKIASTETPVKTKKPPENSTSKVVQGS